MEDVDWILWSESDHAWDDYVNYVDDAQGVVGGPVSISFDDWLLSEDAQRAYWRATV